MRAAALNIPASQVGTTLGVLVGGGAVAQFDRDSNSYDVITQVPRDYRDNPESLGGFFVRSSTGEMVPLSAVTSVKTDASPASIEQFNHLNSATISALPLPSVTTGDGLQDHRGDRAAGFCRTASSSTIPASRGWKRNRATRS